MQPEGVLLVWNYRRYRWPGVGSFLISSAANGKEDCHGNAAYQCDAEDD